MKYGKKLTDDELNQKLHEHLREYSLSPKSNEDWNTFKKIEFNLLIDHRLGSDYPEEKRILLRQIKEQGVFKNIFFSFIMSVARLLPTSIQEKIMNKFLSIIIGKASKFMSKDDIQEMFID